MSRRRSRKRRATLTRILLLIAVIAALALVVLALGRGLMHLIGLFHSDGGATEPDPMFAEEAAQVTRPPDLDEEGAPPQLGDDPSQNWVYEELTPVDKTADELAAEALDEPAADEFPAEESVSDAIAN